MLRTSTILLMLLLSSVFSFGQRRHTLIQSFDELKSISLNRQDAPHTRLCAVNINPTVFSPGSFEVGDVLIIQLFDDRIYESCIDRVVAQPNGTISIRARFDLFPMGYTIFSVYDGQFSGLVHIPELNEKYRLNAFDGSSSGYLKSLDVYNLDILEGAPTRIPDEKVLKHFGYERTETLKKNISENPLAPAVIDVMVVYTPSAASWAQQYEGSINLAVAQSIELSQLALDNSNTNITLNLVFASEVNYTESGSSGKDLDKLTYHEGGLSPLDVVHDWRDQHGADLVTLFTTNDDTGGIAWLLNVTEGYPFLAFSVLRIQNAVYSYSLIHEMAHNMGCHHHKDQSHQPGPTIWRDWPENTWSAGWRWRSTDDKYYCSIMTYNGGSYFNDGINHISVPYFSSPAVNYIGTPTGDAAYGDNARTLREIKHVIAGYRERVEGLADVRSHLITNVTDNSATAGGTVIHEGNAPVVSRGVVWSYTMKPTIDNNIGYTQDGSGLGGFSSNITGLTHSTSYYVRAYATNAIGTAYGEHLQFVSAMKEPDRYNIIRGGPVQFSPNALPVLIAGDDAEPYNSDLQQWYGSWQAPQAIFDQGQYMNDPNHWSNVSDNEHSGSTWLNNSPGNSSGILIVDLQNPEVLRDIRVFQMFSDGKITHIALASHTETGSTSPDVSDEGWTVFLPKSLVSTGLNNGTHVSEPTVFNVNVATRYIKIMAYNDGRYGNQYYIELKGIKIFSEPEFEAVPTVYTSAVTNITRESALAGGSVTFEGDLDIVSRGVVWSKTVMPTLSENDGYTNDGAGFGEFTSEVTNLNHSTDYRLRAYIANDTHVYYGQEVTFTTLSVPNPPGDGSIGNPYQLSSLEDLLWLAQTPSSWGGYFRQTAHIDASSTRNWNNGKGWMPIGVDFKNRFYGYYEGGGYSIDGIYINRPDENYMGLFGCFSGELSNLAVTNAEITGRDTLGVIAGLFHTVKIYSSYSTGKINGINRVGGLAGSVNFCNIENSYSAANVSGQTNIGGLIGVNWNSQILYSYSSGMVSGVVYFGGLSGYSHFGNFVNCYWNGESSGLLESQGGTALNNRQMTQASSFENWDFINAWQIIEGESYPYIIWQQAPDSHNFPPSVTGMRSPSIENGFVIWPNPASKMVSIQAGHLIESIEFVDVSGKIIYSDLPQSEVLTINTSNLSSGLYFVRARINNLVYIQKVFIKR